MIEIFWGCLIGGVLFTVVSLFVGDLFDAGGDGLADTVDIDGADFLNSTTIVTAITAFGGAGVLLARYTSLEDLPVLSLAFTAAAVAAVGIHFLYLKPMKKAETSLGFSVNDLVGRTARVTVPIPAEGYGEILIKVGGGNTPQIAASIDNTIIPTGTEVVVVEARDHTVFVTPFNHTSLESFDA